MEFYESKLNDLEINLEHIEEETKDILLKAEKCIKDLKMLTKNNTNNLAYN